MEETKCNRCGKRCSSYIMIEKKPICTLCYGKIKGMKAKIGPNKGLKCQKCSEIMLQGEAKVHGTFSEFLVVGVSIQHLWFEPVDGSFKEKKVIESSQSAEAYFCKNCKIVAIDATKSEVGRQY